ncbi:enoyl-CoA hydratase/isomerase family protein [Reyranella sp. CPCC 100927]|uniref:enoyl-CoA hydratase/isomerase family protein n=1 Tax=Reyranella sp. CPCC 100927 TaxID=2599616 RepID=UPI0011B6A7E9|nr:enoyl-CoA hydratase/isomerase family protein [Reyranella sp. CPCC 100927]TWT08757.1 enoyl-CoA hydratase/isomerase family protein [Reyranella sp. CPCC 100927]
MQLTHIRFEVADEIATITLNRPDARNALSTEMRQDLDQVLALLKEQAGRQVKAAIITGAGGNFSAGGDVKRMRAQEEPPLEMRKRMRDAHNRLHDLVNLELPVIVAVDGAAAGAGCNLALAGDFILATPRAFFLQAFGRIGLVPDWSGLFLLPRIVGLQKAKELIFSARRLPAAEAKELGIVYAIHSPETLMAEARKLAGRFRHASTAAIAMSKTILNHSFELDLHAVLEMEATSQAIARNTDYHRQAVARFSNRQPSLFDWEAMDREN